MRYAPCQAKFFYAGESATSDATYETVVDGPSVLVGVLWSALDGNTGRPSIRFFDGPTAVDASINELFELTLGNYVGDGATGGLGLQFPGMGVRFKKSMKIAKFPGSGDIGSGGYYGGSPFNITVYYQV